jgi:hypothetical protein
VIYVHSHFDQFEIVRIIPFRLFGNLDLSFTNSSLFLVLSMSAIILIGSYNLKTIIPNK